MSYLESEPVAIQITDTLVSPPRSRKYFGGQNPDATNPIYFTFNGPEGGVNYGRAATTLNGIKVDAGEFYDFTTQAGSGEIRGIATGAPVAAVVNEG